MGTIRFRDLIKSAGTPEIKSLWTNPDQDRDFMRAVKEHRVLTVVQQHGKTDFGEIGFHQQTHSAYLVFPKRLSAKQGDKVIGIKYDLVEQSESADALSTKQLKKLRTPKPTAPPQAVKLPRMKVFKVRIRRVAELESIISVEASSPSEAKKMAIQQANASPFDAGQAEIKTQAAIIK